ncbi:MAG: RsmE family RNA methyltransferase [Salinivenus sp.]
MSMTTNFYAPPSSIQGPRVVLPSDEARHARAVLRVSAGDRLTVVDGEGGWYRVDVQHARDDQVVGRIVEQRQGVGEPPVKVTVGLGLLKKRKRFETFVEKAVELGVRRVVPLRTAHTETDRFRRERVRKKMVAALKQCRRSRLPALEPPRSVHEMLEHRSGGARFICHGTGADQTLPVALQQSDSLDRVSILVGPEGGFHEDEIEAARAAGYAVVSLGARRLRAETAGLLAVAAAVHGFGGEEQPSPDV